MALLDRILSRADDEFIKLPIHQFIASLQEYTLGHKVKADLVRAFALDAADERELDALLAKMDAKPVEQKLSYLFELWGIFVLTERADIYSTVSEARTRIGL